MLYIKYFSMILALMKVFKAYVMLYIKYFSMILALIKVFQAYVKP